MPDGDGLDFLQEIRLTAPDIPAIVMSGNASTERRLRAAQLGVEFGLESIEVDAVDQIDKLDSILEKRADAREFVEGLELSVGNTAKFPSDLPTADEIADEVTKFLREADNEDETP